MNENDKNILHHLMGDGRKSNVEIAMAIGVSEETVRRRRAGLQRDGVYEIMAVPDYRKLGYGVEMLLGIEADLSQIDEVAGALSEVDEVYTGWARSANKIIVAITIPFVIVGRIISIPLMFIDVLTFRLLLAPLRLCATCVSHGLVQVIHNPEQLWCLHGEPLRFHLE